MNCRSLGSEKRVLIIVGLLLVGTLFLVLVFPLRISTDSALYLEAGEKILEGKLPYVDYFEINLPTIHYLSVLPVFAARTLGISSITSFNIIIWMLVTYSIMCFWLIMALNGKPSRSKNLSFLLLATLSLIATWHTIAGNIYGQREHLFLLGFLPYLVLRWARLEGQPAPKTLAFIIGLVAAIVTSIKPHFFLLIVLLEAYVLFLTRSLRPFKQPEVLGAGAAILLLFLYFCLHPQVLDGYLSFIVPAVLEGYDAYSAITMLGVLVLNLIIVLYVAIALLPWLLPRYGTLPLWTLARPFSLMVIGGVIIFVIQRRGWEYHRIIADGAFIVLTGLVLASMIEPTRWLHGSRSRKHALAVLLMAIVLVVFVNTSWKVFAAPSLSDQDELVGALERHSEPGDFAMAFDWQGQPHYPALQVAQLRQASRYLPSFPLCMVLTFVRPEVVYDAQYMPTPLLRRYLDDSIEDIRVYQPSVILMRRGAGFEGCGSLDIDAFLRAQGFLAQLEPIGYRMVEEVGFFSIYARDDSLGQ